ETWLASHPQAPVDVKGESAVLVDVDTHQVLWARDPHSIRAPASLTKVVTAMVVADNVGSLEMPVRVPPEADVQAIQQIEPASTVMWINAGELLTVRELLTGLFPRSGDDAAGALARGLGVTRERYSRQVDGLHGRRGRVHGDDRHARAPPPDRGRAALERHGHGRGAPPGLRLLRPAASAVGRAALVKGLVVPPLPGPPPRGGREGQRF